MTAATPLQVRAMRTHYDLEGDILYLFAGTAGPVEAMDDLGGNVFTFRVDGVVRTAMVLNFMQRGLLAGDLAQLLAPAFDTTEAPLAEMIAQGMPAS